MDDLSLAMRFGIKAAALIESLQAENERLREDPKFLTRMLLDDYEKQNATLQAENDGLRKCIEDLTESKNAWIQDLWKQVQDLRQRLAAPEAVAKRLDDGYVPVMVSAEAGNWYWHRRTDVEDRWEPMSDAERQVLDRLNEPSPE